VHCTSTNATRERMMGAVLRDADSGSPEEYARNSPVEESREIGISCSNIRGRGSFGFCAAAARLVPSTTAKTAARKRPIRGQDFASNFIECSATKISDQDN